MFIPTNSRSAAEQTAVRICAPRKNDPLVIGYFIGNEPPWADRETEVVDMILKGPETATQLKLKEFLQAGDTPERRTNFVFAAFEKQLEIVCGAIRQQDPNHLILGIALRRRGSRRDVSGRPHLRRVQHQRL